MKYFIKISIILSLSLYMSPSEAVEKHHNHHSQYAGQETRTIKSLSEQDITILKNGGGWGFAKAAELNGIPGPAHVLELKKELNLSKDQLIKTTALHAVMKKQAMKLGAEYIHLEKQLDKGFKNQSIDKPALQKLLTKIAEIRGHLRYIHLQTHLDMIKILNKHQITHYNHLRGYSVEH